MSTIPVVTVGGGTAGSVVDRLERLHGPVTVVRRCAELAEVLAACQSGLARAAVINGGSAELTATLVDRLAAVGVAVVALTDDAGEAARLRTIGAVVAGTETGATELADCIAEAVADHLGGPPRKPVTPAAQRPEAHDGIRNPPRGGGKGTNPDARVLSGGRIIAVWGPAGSPGRSMVAANLAAEIALTGLDVVLVDADTYAPSLAPMLGLLDESAALAQACRLADQGVLDTEALSRAAMAITFAGGSMRLLTGLTRADRWPELRGPALRRVLSCCRDVAAVTVIDCGFCLEADEEISFDMAAPRRNAATLASIGAADTVLAIGSGDTLGIPRLVRGLADLSVRSPETRPTVVVNKVRPAAATRHPERALADAWERFGPALPLEHFLPAAVDVLDKALLAGQLLVEAAPESPLRLALRRLALGLCAPVQSNAETTVSTTTASAAR